MEIEKEKYFWAADGMVIRNIHELKSALEVMDERVFSHHVSSQKNDFSSWIKHVLHDDGLAEEVAKITNRQEMLRVLKRNDPPQVKRDPRIAEILKREKEMEKREEKIKEIEERIEKKIEAIKGERGLFTKEFIQGIVTGLLFALLIGLIYLKIFAQ